MKAKELVVEGSVPIVGAGPREKLMEQLNSFRVCNLTAAEQENVNYCKRVWVNALFILSWRWFGISEKQVRLLDERALAELHCIIHEKAKTRALISKFIWWWTAPFMQRQERPTVSWTYVGNTKTLERYYGKNLFQSIQLKDIERIVYYDMG